MNVTKQCRKCGLIFPATIEFFYKKKSGMYGLEGRCKTCTRIAARKWRDDNPDKKKQMDRDYARRNPEHVAEIKRRWAENNPEKKLKASRDYRKRNPGQNTPNAARHRALNPDSTRAIKLRRRARERELPADFTAKDWQIALDYFEGCCAVCGRPAGLWHTIAADHWIPITASDTLGTVPHNIVPLCQGQDGCNNSKSNRNPIEWLDSRVGKHKAQSILERINRYFQIVRRYNG